MEAKFLIFEKKIMKKILAFAGSNSPTSINQQLIPCTASRISEHEVEVLELKTLHLPMYSIALEKEGFPEDVIMLHDKIREADGLMISVNEYNSNVSGFFKNLIDWISRYNRQFLEGKKLLLMSTSPGKRGGAAALEYVKNQFPRFGGQVVESFSLPNFYENFNSEDCRLNEEILEFGIIDVLTNFSQAIKES